MKKKLILPATIVLVIITCTIFMSDGLTYLIASLMALAIMGAIRRNRTRVMKYTRWAKANPIKAQVLIIVLQIVLIALGIFAGNNLKESGYKFSDTTAYVFSAIIIIGFFSIRFLPKRSMIAIPKEVNRNRLNYMGIALSSFVMMVLFGNRMGDIYPASPITHAVKAIDQAIFPDNSTLYAGINDAAPEPGYRKNYRSAFNVESSAKAVFASFSITGNETITLPPDLKKEAKAKILTEKKIKKLEKKKARMMNHISKLRMLMTGGSVTVAVILIILLLIPLCAGICLMISGFSGAGAGTALLGVVLTAGSIFGIIMAVKMLNRKGPQGTPKI